MKNPIKHVFFEKNFQNSFRCENAILETPYLPEILILGTFNPNTPNTNFADFFYGRNYFWTALKNLFIHEEMRITGPRMPKNGKPKKKLNPGLDEIFELCKKLKLTFADLIIEVLHDNSEYHLIKNDNVYYANREFNLIQDNKRGKIHGLTDLNKLNQVNWNTENIITFLSSNPQIKTIYFTRQPTGVWKNEWEKIIKDGFSENRIFTNIFTPSGQGKPVLNSMERLLNHWLFNENPAFGRFEHKLLNKISIEKFKVYE